MQLYYIIIVVKKLPDCVKEEGISRSLFSSCPAFLHTSLGYNCLFLCIIKVSVTYDRSQISAGVPREIIIGVFEWYLRYVHVPFLRHHVKPTLTCSARDCGKIEPTTISRFIQSTKMMNGAFLLPISTIFLQKWADLCKMLGLYQNCPFHGRFRNSIWSVSLATFIKLVFHWHITHQILIHPSLIAHSTIN